jgi:hypothetical protein
MRKTAAASLLIAVTAVLPGSPARAQAVQGKTAAAARPPADWDRTKAQFRELQFVGEDLKVIAIAERIVAAHPGFAEGHFRLGGAHENVARGLARTDRARATRHFEIAATHLRRAFELGGGEYADATIRGLIDLYEYALPNAETWKATVLAALARYPAEPAAHWYGVQLVLREGRGANLDATFRNARIALPSAKSRLEYASLLVGLARDHAQPAVRTALTREAVALADEAVKKSPSDRSVRREADAIREDVRRLQQK